MNFKIGQKAKVKPLKELFKLNNNTTLDNEIYIFFEIVADKKLTINQFEYDHSIKDTKLYFRETLGLLYSNDVEYNVFEYRETLGLLYSNDVEYNVFEYYDMGDLYLLSNEIITFNSLLLTDKDMEI